MHAQIINTKRYVPILCDLIGCDFVFRNKSNQNRILRESRETLTCTGTGDIACVPVAGTT